MGRSKGVDLDISKHKEFNIDFGVRNRPNRNSPAAPPLGHVLGEHAVWQAIAECWPLRIVVESHMKLEVVFPASDDRVICESTLEEIVPAFPLLPLCKQRSREQ